MDSSREGPYLLYGENPPHNKSSKDLWILPMIGERKPTPFLQDAFHLGGRLQADEQPVSVILNWTGLLKK